MTRGGGEDRQKEESKTIVQDTLYQLGNTQGIHIHSKSISVARSL